MPKKRKAPAKFDFKPFSDQQRRLIHWWRLTAKPSANNYVIADGSIRSGKTIACIIGFLTWSQTMFSGQSFILAGKTMGALKKNVVRPMLQMLEAWGWPYEYIRSGTDARLEIGSNTYYLYGANTEAAQDALQGLTAAGAYLDEAALFPKSFVDQAVARCSVDGWKFWMNCNPEGPHHFICEEYLKPEEMEKKKVYHLHFTMDDNLSISPARKQAYKNSWPESSVFYQRFILGRWVMAEGLIYRRFADDVSTGVYAFRIDSKPKDIMEIVLGIDFGGSSSGHSFTATAITQGYQNVVVLASEQIPCKDVYGNQIEIDPEMLGTMFCNFCQKIISRYGFITIVYADSAEQTLIAGIRSSLRRNGLGWIRVENALKTEINDRINATTILMAQGRFYYVGKECQSLVNALCTAVWNPKEVTKNERLDDGTSDIDSLDSFEYTFEWRISQLIRFG